MDRRKAIKRLALGALATGAAVSGYQYYKLVRKPDIETLNGEKALLAALADTIIPDTDSPGAAAAQTEEYILVMLRDCTDRKTLNRFLDGLMELKSKARRAYGKDFEKCTPEQRIAVLKAFEKRGRSWPGIMGKAQRRLLGQSFFNTLKEYTVAGYCSSRLGAEQGLRYAAVPGRFQGCIPLQKGEKAWATS